MVVTLVGVVGAVKSPTPERHEPPRGRPLDEGIGAPGHHGVAEESVDGPPPRAVINQETDLAPVGAPEEGATEGLHG